MNVPMTFRTPLASLESAKDEQFFFGIYYGILLVMAILNLFMFFSVRNSDYLLYIFYVVSSALFQLTLNGLDVEYLWQNALWWSLHAAPILGSLFSIGMNLFSKQFLHTKVYAPAFDKILTVLVVIFILNIPISIIFEYRIGIQILSVVSIFGSFVTIAAGVQCLMRGFRPARLYVVSFIGFIFGIIVLVLQNYNIVPYSFIANNSIQIGSALEVVLMSFALADRFRIMQKEKEDVQREAFEEQLKMANSFSRFVPREFLSLLKKESIVNIELGDQILQEMPVLFTDIRSYTSLSEKMTPQENIDFLNLHLANVVPIIKSHNGFIDKFIGDAIMALFPGGVNDAVSAAVEMQKKVKEFNDAGNAPDNNPIQIGIGIHIGKLMLGTIGEKDRLETTVISDAVNIASRLEGLNKKFSTGILISDDVYIRLDNPDQFNIKKIGLVRIRGKENAVRILEVAVPQIYR
jgi:adenylate cyclase